MKKKQHDGDIMNYLHKTMRIMQLSLFLIIISTAMAISANSYSQNAKLTMDLNNVTVKDVLKTIENQSEFIFFYQEKHVDLNRQVTLRVAGEDVETILDQLFAGTDNIYVINDRQIVIGVAPRKELEKQIQRIDGNVKPALVQPQQKEITGKVTDTGGLPLPGVSVIVKGTTIGTVTNGDGEFSLNIPMDAEVLQFSFVGMQTQELPIEGRTTFTIVMDEETIGIEEVVAVGYGTLRKRDLTGSVSSINSENIGDLTISRAEQAMVGKMAGVMVKQSSGKPGESPQILIRGYNSIDKSMTPLFVVDGHPIDDLSMINPNDIESIDVLKDASATAIYGSRGTNGVVLVTTKRGRTGESRIELNVYTGIPTVSNKVEMMNAREIAQFQIDSWKQRNIDEGNDVSGHPSTWILKPDQIVMDVVEGNNTTDTDWQDEVFKRASPSVQSYHLAISGGSESTDYYLSGEYFSEAGLIQNSDYNRYSIRMSIDSKVNNWLKVGGTLNPSFSHRNEVVAEGRGENLAKHILSNALLAQPFMPVYNENGEYLNMYGFPGAVNNTHPVAIADLITDYRQTGKVLGNLYSEFKFTDNFNFRTSLGYSLLSSREKYFRPEDNAFQEGIPFGSNSTSQVLNWLNTNTINYSKLFNDLHQVDVLLGYEIQKNIFENNSLNSNKYPNNLIQTLNVASAIDAGSSFESEWTMLSYLSRINYNYNQKYYLTASIRRDGSSRFGPENKWGLFPSVALAWRLIEEDMMKKYDFLSDFKLRASYGVTGNNNIGDYLYIPTVETGNYILGNNLSPSYHPNRIANPFLRWEYQNELNTGLDLGLYNNRFYLSADYFVKRNEDLLLNVQIPGITGFSNTTQNIGTIQNKGWEFTLTSQNVAGRFNWVTNFNISFYANEVLALGPEGDDIISNQHITRVGEPIGMFFGYKTDGVIMNQQELENSPIFNPGGRLETRVGDIRFVDISGPDGVPDGIIDADDRTIIGNPHPDFIYGMTNSLSFENFDLTISLQGIYGNDLFYLPANLSMNTRGRRNQLAVMNNYWKSESDPGNGIIPRANHNPTGNNRGWSDFYIQDGSFLRVTDITLGYLLPDGIIGRYGIQKVRLYIRATNPLTFTNYTGYNPDVSFSDSPLYPGQDNNTYPVPRTYSFGINLSF